MARLLRERPSRRGDVIASLRAVRTGNLLSPDGLTVVRRNRVPGGRAMNRLMLPALAVLVATLSVPAVAQLGTSGSRDRTGGSLGSSGFGSDTARTSRGAGALSEPSTGSSLSREPAGAPTGRVPTGDIGVGVGAGANTLSGSITTAPLGRIPSAAGGLSTVPSTETGARGDCPPGSSPDNPTFTNCLPSSSAIPRSPR